MIIGHGDIASALVDDRDRLYFAAGVSNSRETRESEYLREKELLLAQPRHLPLIYFSSLCIFYSATRYAQHKWEMEQRIKVEFPRWTIVRLGNITWGVNPHTLINALRAQVARGEPLEIQDTERYLVDQDELRHWLEMIPPWNCEMNVPGRRLTVQQVVDEFVGIPLKLWMQL